MKRGLREGFLFLHANPYSQVNRRVGPMVTDSTRQFQVYSDNFPNRQQESNQCKYITPVDVPNKLPRGSA